MQKRTQKLKKILDDVQRKIDYRFSNKTLLFQAFTRSSYSTQYGGENNEVLEFIGDTVLDYYVVKVIADIFKSTKSESDYYNEEEDDEYCIYYHKNQAYFTELKKQMVSNRTLAKRIDKFGFAEYLFMGDSDRANHVERHEKVKADLFEAILGAVTIDSDWDPDKLQNTVENMLQIDDFFDDVDIDEPRPDQFKVENAINTLKELAEHGKCSFPEYEVSDEQVYEKGKWWWACTCNVRNWHIKCRGLATSKKEAKRYATYLVLCNFYGLPNEFEKDSNNY